MEHILLVVHVFIAAALIGLVLLQRSESDGFGMGSGSGSNLLSGRATANLLTRLTSIVAGLFLLNSLVLSVMAAHDRAPSIVDTIEQQQKAAAPTPAPAAQKATVPVTPAAPVVPLAGADKKSAEPSAAPTQPAPAEAAKPVTKASKPAAKKAASTDETDTQNQ